MTDPTKWDWADSVSGAIMGVLTGVITMFGWFHRKLGKVHDRIDLAQSTAAKQATSIKVLEAHHGATMERLARIELNSQTINSKQDRQMEILLELERRR